ncbi:MAG: hypothetical protein LBC27_07570 [Spirochaetaceae bacterium]|nr:hypothetical protein [Spirochaetaceae bacterium]
MDKYAYRYIFLLLFMSLVLFISCEKQNKNIHIEIPFSLENNTIVIEAEVEGKKGRYIFDTGATISYIDIGKENVWYRNYIYGIYEGKLSKLSIYNINKIRFGDIEVKSDSWIISKVDIINDLKAEGYDGLLGNRIFEGYWCELSFSKQKIILSDLYDTNRNNFYNYSTALVENKYNSPLYIPVTINNNKDFYFMIDTGMNISLRFPDNLYQYTDKEETLNVFSSNEEGNHHLVKLDSLRILDETYTDIYALTNSIIAKRNNNDFYKDFGLIGLPFLKYYDFLFDYRDLRRGKTTGFYYKSNTPLEERDYGFFSFLKEPPEFGIIDYKIDNSGIIVTSILEDSIAYKDFNIQPGVLITKINGKPIMEFPIDILRDPLFYRSVDNYTILKDGVEQTINSPLKYEIPVPD